MGHSNRVLRTTLLGLLVGLVLIAVVLVTACWHGFTIASFSIAGLRIEQFSVQLQRKLVLDVGLVALDLPGSATPSTSPTDGLQALDPKLIRTALDAIGWIVNLFAAIDLRQIQLGDRLQAEFRYREQEQGHLLAAGPLADVAVGLALADHDLLIDIERLSVPGFGLRAKGRARVDTTQRLMTAALAVTLADTLPVEVHLEASRQNLRFWGRGEAAVESIAPVVELLQLGPEITPWLSDYLRASEITLQAIHGRVPYANPAQLLQTLYAEIRVKDPEYTFAQGLEPALAAQTRLVFQRGVLSIHPSHSTFYGQDGGDTHVDIDFNDGRALLTVFVRTRAQASGGVLALLEHYGIPFPYEQVVGMTDAHLDLRVDLSTLEIEADGQFVAADSVFEIGELRFEVAQLDVGLQTTVVLLRSIDVAIPELFAGSVAGVINAGTGFGELAIDVHQFDWREAKASLSLQVDPRSALRLDYQFRPGGDTVHIDASNWRFGALPIALGAIDTPFSLSTFGGSLSDVSLAIDSWLRARVSGTFQRSTPYATLQFALTQLGEPGRPHGEQGLQLAQSGADVLLSVGPEVAAKIGQPVALSYNDTAIVVQPSRVRYGDGVLRIERGGFRLGAAVTAGLQGWVNPGQGRGQLLLKDLDLGALGGTAVLVPGDEVALDLSRGEGGWRIASSSTGLLLARQPTGAWSIEAQDVATLHAQSPLLQRFGFDSGALRVASGDGGEPYVISGWLDAPFGLLVQQNRQASQALTLNGSYAAQGLRLDINEQVQLQWHGSLEVESAEVGYSWSALQAVFAAVFPSADADPTGGGAGGLNFNLRAQHSFLQLDDERRVPIDDFTAHYGAGKTSMTLYHRAGFGSLDFVDGEFYLGGEGFEDSFFNEFMTLADFEGGTLEFEVQGPLDDLQSVFRIENTVIKDYKHLNNMLAFVNTIPGLLTFKLPDYSNKGLPAKEAYAGMTYGDGLFTITSLRIDSDELGLTGSGTIDLNDDTVDMAFNLISGVKRSINRIPLLGYVLTGGDEKPSIALTVQGDLHDPQISNTAFREVVSFPFQVLKRTVLLPAHITEQMQDHARTRGPQKKR